MSEIIKVTELTPDQIIPEPLEKNERSNDQLMGYVRNKSGNQVTIQSCAIQITDYGVPGYHKQFYDTFDKRAHIKIPLDKSQNPNIQKMIDNMLAVDEKFNSEEIRKFFFGDEWEEWEYQDIIRESAPAKDGRERPPYMKLKLDTVYETEYIATLLRNNDNEIIKAEGANSVDDQQLYTIEEFCNHVKYKSKIKLQMTPCKVWTMSQQMGKKKIRNYGVQWKVKQIQVTPPQYASSSLKTQAFLPDDDDDMMNNTMESSSAEGLMITQDTIDDIVMNSSSPSEEAGDSSDDDDDDEPIVKKSSKKKTKSKSKAL